MPSTNSKPLTSAPAAPLDSLYCIKTLTDPRSDPAQPPPLEFTSQTDIALAYLSTTTKLEDLHTSLLHSLSASGWTERVRNLAFELLRSGRCTRFEDVVDNVVRLATTAKPSDQTPPTVLGKRKREGKELNGTAATNGVREPAVKKEHTSDAEEQGEDRDKESTHKETNGTAAAAAKPNGKHASTSGPTEGDNTDGDDSILLAEFDVRIPPHVVGKGVKILNEALGDICIKPTEDEDQDGEAEPDDQDDDDASDLPLKVKSAKMR
ncbi:predicted protein [Uncinocarpus reesii 1704]|uniref:Uncharacterized protein n=1 Tax=Uncinocarpus reesii (strain UAMH 1704) TaxID=336963 RepID=C4JUU8_UNCRE|nr:uncharacterized protein UREG_04901 [Uncinocarpus reesii 1704]EEP80059.1 predicted protein [Uncinocarpus reesii 1704]